MKWQIFIFWGLLASILLVWPTLNSYFAQDDFFHFRLAQEHSLVSLFQLPEGYWFYRPIGREIYNWLIFNLFGLSPLPYHLLVYALYLVNAALAALIVKRLTEKIQPAAVVFFLMTSSVIINADSYYLASNEILMSSIFMLAALYFYLKCIDKKSWKLYTVCIGFYLAALLSQEVALVFPLILLAIEGYIAKTANLKTLASRLLAPAMLSVALVFVDVWIIGLPPDQQYQAIFTPKTIANSIFWYGLWGMGISEILVDFVRDFKFSPDFLIWYANYLKIAVGMMIIFVSIMVSLLLKDIRRLPFGQMTLFMTLFVISLLPFLVLPDHKQSYYLSFGQIWLYGFLAVILSRVQGEKRLRTMIIIGLAAFFLTNFATSRLNAKTYWAAKRAKAAQVLLYNIQKQYPQVAKSSTFYFVDDKSYPDFVGSWGSSSKQASFILSGADALKVVYNDRSISALYDGVGHLPKNINHDKVLMVEAVFPY